MGCLGIRLALVEGGVLGEETGLTAISGLATARDDLRRVRAAGAVVTQDPAHPSDTTAELFLQIA